MNRTFRETPAVWLAILVTGCGSTRLEPIGFHDGTAGARGGGADTDAATSDGSGGTSGGGRNGSGGRAASGGSVGTGGAGTSSCAPDTWDDDGNSATPCVNHTSCSPGKAVSDPGSATLDRRCSACPAGTFSAQTNAPSCSPWSDCARGSYVSAAGTAAGDRECTVCPKGQGTLLPNASACVPLTITQAVTGERQTCVLLSDGSVKCWGGSAVGQLGYGNVNSIGDDELPSSVGPVSITNSPGVTVTALAAGQDHTCALLSDGSVKCWGGNAAGQLGYGNVENIGDNELPSSVGPVSVTTTPGVTATAIIAGWTYTCALLSDGSVKCWGSYGTRGGIGYGNVENIGDNELPSSVGPISVTTTPGVTVTALAGGLFHTCALLSDTSVKCWGRGGSGQLGYGNMESIGDDELPSSVGAVSVTTTPGVTATALAGGSSHTCARLSDGSVKCWGSGGANFPAAGVGYGNTDTIGDDELPSSVGAVSVTTTPGVTVRALSGGFAHTCALLSDGSVKCWGWNIQGQLGQGNTDNLGDNELPSSVGAVSVTTTPGVTVTALAPGNSSYDTCALLSNGSVKCWGLNADGELGYGTRPDIGDDELPSSVGPAVVF